MLQASTLKLPPSVSCKQEARLPRIHTAAGCIFRAMTWGKKVAGLGSVSDRGRKHFPRCIRYQQTREAVNHNVPYSDVFFLSELLHNNILATSIKVYAEDIIILSSLAPNCVDGLFKMTTLVNIEKSAVTFILKYRALHKQTTSHLSLLEGWSCSF